MRRIAFLLLALALVGAYWACSADAPVPTPPGQGGHPPSGNSPLQIVLFTGDANPVAGTCTLIQAIVTLNGVAVSDGTGVLFSTDFGVFSQNGSPSISVVTTKGTALTSVCSNSSGTAFVNASANVAGNSAKAQPLKIVFQPAAQAVPFFSSCSPSFGPSTGGTSVTINGGRFPGIAATTRATFTVLGITREAPVTSVTPSAVVVMTPAFPEVASATPVAISITFLANSSPITLSVPNCFAFGVGNTDKPSISAVLPSSGSKDGNTRVSIIGAGFSAPVQVFFGSVEATVVSISFSQIVALSPPVFAFGSLQVINTPLDVRVHEVNSGLDATLAKSFTYVLPLQITSIDPTQMRTDSIRPLTIFGHGFRAPVAVVVAGLPATVISVSDSELQVLPATPAGCGAAAGSVVVTNISTGETISSPQTFTYIASTITISSVFPSTGPSGTAVTITGTNLPSSIADADVRFGGVSATVTSAAADGTSLIVTVPAGVVAIPPVCPATTTSVPITVKSRASGCLANTVFDYASPCATPTPTPVPPTPTFTPTP